ncbi:RagB/SusD family nutrient uptake outer membrane protein [Sphingobacterium oryzagri]|uniref:RagB/SusD family nutrient uptake outer membrane protein n=1 Tax=Sphingobacterium oryzagri TaxID=3025669 RepID=A0ABY7WGC6_9SPHI|nr:RagB/SusD family nutrient uptake outer membrane protein [Sphingobacterium sp. KACC 22765]WDF67557.1 RagB/SusD family nutrient uptake outer membrane protein [Sphingobacterium sp. KACC 22765]
MKTKIIKLLRHGLLIVGTAIGLSACQDYIDVVPDNLATIENAFTLRNEAEKYLFTCYSYLPENGDALSNTGLLAGDEVWIPFAQRELLGSNWHIARGSQNKANPLVNIWSTSMWRAIRDCNIFLENVSNTQKVLDLTPNDRSRWIGEVKFLKAYYHFLLMRAYGAIPLVKENLGIDATAEQVRVVQRPVDETTDYIVSLLDEALETSVPTVIQDRGFELGRITKPIILAVKAQVLLTAASPLFNGNSDYANFTNSQNELLFNQSYDEQKWVKAAEAAKAAMDGAEAAGFALFRFNKAQYGALTISDQTATTLSVNLGFNERWQTEHIWANPNSLAWNIQRDAMARLETNAAVTDARSHLAAPVKIAEMYYSRNGVPIGEDKTLDFTNRFTLRTATEAERYYIEPGYRTARLNYDREPRFYAHLGFDGGVWFKYSTPSNSDEDTYVLNGKLNQMGGFNTYGWGNETGYFLKKLVNWEQNFSTSGVSYKNYPWPDIRLSDVYLMFAEAANEAYGPSQDVYDALDKIRARAGLAGVLESWSSFSTNPGKPTTKDGLREIVQRERMIELAFEGKRFWDLRRWKLAVNYLNQNITGWSVFQEVTTDYYRLRTIYPQTFVAPRDYFWPISEYELTVNPSLVQNPGW